MRLNIIFVWAFVPISVLANQAFHPRTAASTLSLASSASSASYPTSPTSSFSTPPTAYVIALTGTPTDTEEPQITEAPEFSDADMSMMLQEKYHITTYWSCVTIGTQVHCGWHEPVLPGGDEIAGASGRMGNGKGRFGQVVALAVAVVGVFMR
jgi:hypothetical protein